MKNFRCVVMIPHVMEFEALSYSHAKHKLDEAIHSHDAVRVEGGGKKHHFAPTPVSCEEVTREGKNALRE